MRVEIPNQITVTIGGLISRGVKAVEVTDAGKLIFTLTDGSVIDLGSVIGPEGPKGETGPEGPAGPAGVKGDAGAAGASIMSIEKSAQSGTTSTYTITMSDGQTFDFEVQSDKGEKGDKGDTGATGPKGPQGEQGPAGIVVQETEPTDPTHPVWINPNGNASIPSSGSEETWEIVEEVPLSSDTDIYYLADFAIYRKIRILMDRPSNLSITAKIIRLNFATKAQPLEKWFSAGILGNEYKNLHFDIKLEVSNLFATSEVVALNGNDYGSQIYSRGIKLLGDVAPSELTFYMRFTDPSVIQPGDTLTILGVKR